MRSHPVVGTFFIAVAAGLFVLGATASSAPAPLSRLPVPPEIVMPFVFWQLAVWAALFGAFFLRPRSRSRSRARNALRARPVRG